MNQERDQKGLDVFVADRRGQPRFVLHHVQYIKAKPQAVHSDQALAAKLVDISDGGVGVDTTSALDTGSFVSICGELHSTRFCVGLLGRVRVAYCRPLKEGAFRIGLAFEGAFCRNLHCDHHTPPGSAGMDNVPVPTASFSVGGPGEPRAQVPNRLWGDFYIIPSLPVATSQN